MLTCVQRMHAYTFLVAQPQRRKGEEPPWKAKLRAQREQEERAQHEQAQAEAAARQKVQAHPF